MLIFKIQFHGIRFNLFRVLNIFAFFTVLILTLISLHLIIIISIVARPLFSVTFDRDCNSYVIRIIV